MKFAQISVLALALAGPAAHAQWEDDWNPWETETDLGASLVMMPEADEQILARTWAGVSTNRILDSGLEIGAAGRMPFPKLHAISVPRFADRNGSPCP